MDATAAGNYLGAWMQAGNSGYCLNDRALRADARSRSPHRQRRLALAALRGSARRSALGRGSSTPRRSPRFRSRRARLSAAKRATGRALSERPRRPEAA